VFTPFPLAFGFTNLALLGWLGAAAAPILIHLWMRHTHHEMPWAAMEFLREAIQRNARRLKLQQWILLAVRTLLLILLVLAAAKPYLSGGTILGGGPKVHRLLVLDASFSMAYHDGEQTLFTRAQQLAEQLLDSAPPGEVFSVCLMANPPRAMVTGPVADSRSLRQALAACEPTNGGANLEATLELVKERIDKANDSDRHFARHEVFFFTDLGKSSWQSIAGEPGASSLDALEEIATLAVVDVGSSSASNLAVNHLRLESRLATTAVALRVECEVSNHADQAVEGVVVQLVADGSTFEEQTVSLPARGNATLTFDASFSEATWHSLSVRLPGDSLPIDDEAWLVANVRERARMLLVEGSPHVARYLVHSLNPSGTIRSPLEPIVVAEGGLAEMPLEEFDSVFLCNIAQFTPQEAKLLKKYTARGGSTIFFLGDRVEPEAYNEVLGAIPSANRNATLTTSLLPVRIGPLTTSNELGLDPLDYRHPIVAAFRGRERAGLLSTPVSLYYKLHGASEPGTEVAIALPGGDPFLVTQSFGRGSVAVVATSASLDTLDAATQQPWTLMPAWPSFLPIVRELVAFTTAENSEESSRVVGDLIFGTLPPIWSAPSIDLHRPDGRRDSLPVERTNDEWQWSYASTDQPGIYKATATGGEEPLSLVALNVDPTESDLTRIDPKTLPPSITLHPGEPTSAGGLPSETPLHRWLLYGVLSLLLLDSILAWSFGGRSA